MCGWGRDQVELERERRQRWEDAMSRWRRLRTLGAIKQFQELMRSEPFAAPPARAAGAGSSLKTERGAGYANGNVHVSTNSLDRRHNDDDEQMELYYIYRVSRPLPRRPRENRSINNHTTSTTTQEAQPRVIRTSFLNT